MTGRGRWSLAWSWLFAFSACTVDGSVIDDLPCECADGFVCDTRTNRCVLDDGRLPDAGMSDTLVDAADRDAADPSDAADALDAGRGDGGPDMGPVRDPDLGDCLGSVVDDFSQAQYDMALWGETTDNAASVALEDGEFIGRVPAMAVSDYAFLFARETFDLSECTTLIEITQPSTDPDATSFFIARIDNDAFVGFDLVEGSLRAIIDDETMPERNFYSEDYDSTAHRWVGLRGDAGEIVWIVSADGVAWREFARRTVSLDVSGLQLIFGVGSLRDNAMPLEARFDNFNRLP